MNNFIFKSSKGLIKNDSINLMGLFLTKINLVLAEQRHQREDLRMLSQKLDRILVDKHLQMQVDEYFEHENSPQPEDTADVD